MNREIEFDRQLSEALMNTVGALVIILDREGRVVRFNRACETITGYQFEEVKGKCFWDFLLIPEEIEKVRGKFSDFFHGKLSYRYENYWKSKDGTLHWIAWSNACLTDSDGNVEFVVGTGLDLTERKRIEVELQKAQDKLEEKVAKRTEELSTTVSRLEKEIEKRRRSEIDVKYFSQVLERSLNEIYIFDVKSLHFVEVNRGARENLGYTSEELRGMTPLDLKPEFTPESFENLVEPLLSGMKEKVEFSTVHRRKDGSIYPVEIHLQLIDGNTPFFVAIIMDISERLEAEKALRESEEKFRNLIETTSDWIWETDSEGVYTYSSPQVESLLGYQPEEIIGKTPFGLMSPEEADRIRNTFKCIVKNKEPIVNMANTCIHKNGTPVVIETSGVPVCDSNGEIIRYRGIDRDITDRKAAEEELRRYEEMVSSSSDRIAFVDANLVYLAANEAYLRSLGKTREELIGENAENVFNKKDFHEIIEPNARRCLQGEEVHYLEWIEFPTLGRRHMDVAYFPYRGTDNSIEGLVVFARDDTDRKQIEDALRESEERYRAVLNTMTDAVVIVGQDNKIQFVNKGFCDMYGYTEKEALGMMTTLLIREDFHPLFRDFVKQITETGHFSGETIDIRKDGAEFNVEVRGGKIRLGGQNCLLAVIRNVTERKKTQQALEEHTNKLTLMHQRLEVRNSELQKALDEIATLRGILPICSFCKKVRDDEGYWQQVDMYISKHTDAKISHGICPECLKKHYPDLQ